MEKTSWSSNACVHIQIHVYYSFTIWIPTLHSEPIKKKLFHGKQNLDFVYRQSMLLSSESVMKIKVCWKDTWNSENNNNNKSKFLWKYQFEVVQWSVDRFLFLYEYILLLCSVWTKMLVVVFVYVDSHSNEHWIRRNSKFQKCCPGKIRAK